MILLAGGLVAPALAGAPSPEGSVPISSLWTEPQSRHPGQNGPLTPTQRSMAEAAWRYFENNFQPSTCLYNSVEGYPSTTMWDTASAIGALVAAFELELVDSPKFDERMGCLLASLNRMALYKGELPNKAYHTVTLGPVDYSNEPGEIGVSAIDLGRMLVWLAIVKERYPRHAEAIDRFVLRWDFCNVVDDGGALYGAANAKDGGVVYLQEGRLGYEEYAAAGFQLWGFDTTAASQADPMAQVRIQGVPIAYDARDPKVYGAHNYVVTEAYLLAGMELNWDRVDEPPGTDLWTSDRLTRRHAERVYRAQFRRWRETGILTARTEHHVDRIPWFVYDTVFSDGVEWNTLSDEGHHFPELAALSTKAAVGMSVLFDTPYTDRLMAAVLPLVDHERGLFEGLYEVDGRRIETVTANTNGVVLETLLYKVQGKLYRDNGLIGVDSLWERTPNGEYPGNWQCLPRSSRELARAATADRRGQLEVSVQSAH